MSRKSAIAASAALVLVLAAGPAPAFAASSAAPVGPVVTSPIAGGGDVQPAGIWTWLCQVLGGCK